MSKILIFSDIHLQSHKEKENDRRLEDGIECLEWIYSQANTLNIKSIIIAGDFFHNRFFMSINAYARICNLLKKYNNNIKTYFLLGNHDMNHESDWDSHSLISIKEWMTVIDSPQTLNIEGFDIDFLPYTPTPSKYINNFSNKSNVLISHLAVADAILNSKYEIKSIEEDFDNKEVVNVNVFNGWKKVFLGHYHYAQKLNDTVEYIGSPMQLSFGEANQEKHIIVLDPKTLKTEYIKNSVSPKYIIIEDEKDINIKDINKSYVQIRNNESIESKFSLKKKLIESGARSIDFMGGKKDNNMEVETKAAINNIKNIFNNREQLIESYIDNIKLPDHIEINRIKQITKGIVNGI